MRLAVSQWYVCDYALYTQLGQRRGSTLPQELQDTTPTEQVGTPPNGGGGGGGRRDSLVHTQATLCDVGGQSSSDCRTGQNWPELQLKSGANPA